ncbi:hypothetical protein A2209_01445 [Candidatus Roizmanbacteria bacterium RIFOXYA1_FULL_41_12]|uniref:Reactive intermediate/imine deaminase n=2 Tax=Microgenomates group TaxID=1794810 RepID=A0A1F5F589_9BACT|nr:MAG: Endoribonuclease L-PSP [Microgenomates group bacterium GW2011_GWF1_46_12]OGD74825.1 MAG: hypothetical protein A2228_00070 [Candidatus Collierbacteria bacterium RIFOXYA2_FULL_46_10]OGK67091.1 MAG: hypothetical protein A2209_01445 [Candidatus Roizmanbacteria bacterium RIFOXYA1_FULL_41_12]HBD02443.1 hypothetical protein [Candidatus Collierbacteria bacterium]
MKTEIKTVKAPSAPGLLSQAVRVGKLIYTAGYIPVTNDWKLVEGSVEAQLEVIIKDITEVLHAGGAGIKDVVKVTIYLTDMTMLPELNKYYSRHFGEVLPAREVVGVAALPLGAKMEMSVIAVKS